MTVSDRLRELRLVAEQLEVDLSGLEVWEPFSLMIAIGLRLGLSREEIVAPVTSR